MRAQKASTLSADIFATLKARIICWEYPPAHRFTEEELCEEFGVSRSPIREALQMLIENSLVTKEPYRGYEVRQPDMQEIHDLYDLRLALELYVMEWLVTNGMPEAKWMELQAAWESILSNTLQLINNFAELDESFHEQLAECTGNQALVYTLRGVNERLHFIRMTDITNPARLRETCEQHLIILDRLKQGDVQEARTAMKNNIEGGRRKVEQAIKEALSRPYINHRTLS